MFEAKEMVGDAARLDKYVTDRKISYNTYDDEGNRVFVKTMAHNPFVKGTRWSGRCVKTPCVKVEDGWSRVEDRVPLCHYELFDRQRNCLVFTHNEGLVIPSSGATPRVRKRVRQEPVVSDRQQRKTFTHSQRKD